MHPLFQYAAIVVSLILLGSCAMPRYNQGDELDFAVHVLAYLLSFAAIVWMFRKTKKNGLRTKKVNSNLGLFLVVWLALAVVMIVIMEDISHHKEGPALVLTYIFLTLFFAFNLFHLSKYRMYPTKRRRFWLWAVNSLLVLAIILFGALAVVENLANPYLDYTYYYQPQVDGMEATAYVISWICIWSFSFVHGLVTVHLLRSGKDPVYSFGLTAPEADTPPSTLIATLETGRPFYQVDAAKLLSVEGAYKYSPVFENRLMDLHGLYFSHTEEQAKWMQQLGSVLKSGINGFWKPHEELLKFWPNLYCRVCYARAEQVEQGDRTAVICKKCGKWQNLASGIVTVKGVLGGLQQTDRIGSDLWVPLWKNSTREIAVVELDEVHIQNTHPENLDWAVSAFLQKYQEAPRLFGERIKVYVYPEVQLAENTLRMLEGAGFLALTPPSSEV